MQAKQLSLKPAAAYGAVSRHPRPRGLLRRGKHGSLTRLTCSKVSTEMFHRSGISRISVFAYELLLRFRSFQFDRANVHAIERAANVKRRPEKSIFVEKRKVRDRRKHGAKNR